MPRSSKSRARKTATEAPPKPKIFSSADTSNTAADPTSQKVGGGPKGNWNREPTDTERKLAQQGLIPPVP